MSNEILKVRSVNNGHFVDARGDLELVKIAAGPKKGRYALVVWGSAGQVKSADAPLCGAVALAQFIDGSASVPAGGTVPLFRVYQIAVP